MPANTIILGEVAFDIDYLNSDSNAQMMLIEWFNAGNEVYVKLSENTIVTIDGRLVSNEVLPERVFFYNSNGDVVIYEK